MREFTVDLSGSKTFGDFVAAFNSGFCRFVGGQWHGRSWDAFHDFLSWPEDEKYRLRLEGWQSCVALKPDEQAMVLSIFRENPHVDVVFS